MPLPADEIERGQPHGRRSQRRVHLRRKQREQVRATVTALNELAGYERNARDQGPPHNDAQRTALGSIFRAVETREPPPLELHSQTPKGALAQLLHTGALYGEGPGQLAVFSADRVSLPRDQQAAVRLEDVLPDDAKRDVTNFAEVMMLSGEEHAALIESGYVPGCYFDPVLDKSPKTYAKFLISLFSAGIVKFTARPKVVNGLFFC